MRLLPGVQKQPTPGFSKVHECYAVCPGQKFTPRVSNTAVANEHFVFKLFRVNLSFDCLHACKIIVGNGGAAAAVYDVIFSTTIEFAV